MPNVIEYFRHIWNGQIIKIINIKIVCYVILPKSLIHFGSRKQMGYVQCNIKANVIIGD